jgi:hypothetical protein
MAIEPAIHAIFHDTMEQLSEVSEAFHREGISFVKSLLTVDPAQRPTAEDALRHPFLTSTFVSSALDSMPPKVRTLIPQTTQGREAFEVFLTMCGDKEE